MIKQDAHLIKGIQRDLTKSRFSPEYAFDAQNIRITAREDNTLLSITNEKGNKELKIELEGTQEENKNIQGEIIGYNVLNEYLTLFTTTVPDDASSSSSSIDRIYRIHKGTDDEGNTTYKGALIYEGNLNFNYKHPIESIGVYEKEDILKVYWVDGLNPPRYINILGDYKAGDGSYINKFEFAQELDLKEKITITKNSTSNGSFPAGVVQYAFSYYNLYGSESNIFYTTPLNYITHSNRGASAEDTLSCSFTIKIDNVDQNFEYLRIYSIIRSSIDETASVKNIVDIKITGTTLIYTDTNTTGEQLDSTTLLYIGGDNIIAGTMAAKDNTLFLGNITLNTKLVPEEIRNTVPTQSTISFISDSTSIPSTDLSGYYAYNFPLVKNSSEITSFKYGETYRFGIQFQDKSGRWSEVIYISDKTVDTKPIFNDGTVSRVIASYEIGSTFNQQLVDAGYVKARGVIVYPTLQDRTIIAQGIVCPTVYRLGDRVDNAPFVQSSWFCRPNIYFNKEFSTRNELVDSSGSGLIDIEIVFNIRGVNADASHDSSGITTTINLGPRTLNLEVTSYSTTLGNIVNTITCKSSIPIDIDAIPITGTLHLDNPIQSQTEYSYYGYTVTGPTGLWDRLPNNDISPSDQSRASMWNSGECIDNNNQPIDLTSYGSYTEFRHNYPIPDNTKRYAEIQSISNPLAYPITTEIGSSLKEINRDHTNDFFIDQSVVTFHSPEVEFDSDIQNLSEESFNFRIVGYVPIDATKGALEILASGTYGDNEVGAYLPNIGSTLKNYNAGKNLSSGIYWIDEIYNPGVDNEPSIGYVVYPWHRNGSLNNDTTRNDGSERSAVLQSKKISNLKYSSGTTYLNNSEEYSITPIQVFNSNEVTAIRIKSPENSDLPDLVYFGNVNSVITPTINQDYVTGYSITNAGGIVKETFEAIRKSEPTGYPIVVTTDGNIGDAGIDEISNLLKDYRTSLISVETTSGNSASYTNYGIDPIELRYNSTPHIVFALNYDNLGRQIVLPTNSTPDTRGGRNWNNNVGFTTDYGHFLWTSLKGDTEFPDTDGVIQDTIDIGNNYYPYLWLGELYRNEVNNRFGGNSNEAIINNRWYPAGTPVNLDGNSVIEVQYTVGDTFLSRYDCLKTYSSVESTNNITEIISFMCETHVNIDGRYDRNRGLLNNNTVSPTNFNLFNPVYNQKDTYFTQSAIDYTTQSTNNFPNTITWSEEKHNASIIDEWTKFTLASSLELDGDKGGVTSLNVFNNEIYCFQKQGLSNILFNSRVQIPTSDGTPIEITNGLKVGGKRYISNTIGCDNKWSIVETPSGIYFIDDITNSLYIFNGQISSLSDKLGFRQWVSSNNSKCDWDPVDFKNFVSFYDKNNNDVYFINSKYCLVYSELLGQFTSFMSYNKVPFMFNIDSDFYAIKDNILYEQFAGDYNTFFGAIQPYSITIISNPDEPYDKIFNNLEFRADRYTKSETSSWELSNKIPFNYLEVSDEYQNGFEELTFRNCRPSNLKKKFRVWRANIPRSSKNKMDRIRNTWAIIKLSNTDPSTDKIELHDMIVHYFI